VHCRARAGAHRERVQVRRARSPSAHESTDPPADDVAREDIDDEGDRASALPGRNVGEIRHPERVGAVSFELPVDPVERTRGSRIRHRGANNLASNDPTQPELTHESLDRAARHRDAFAVEPTPDLIGSVDLQVGLPDPLDVSRQHLVTLGPSAAPIRLALLFARKAPVGRGATPRASRWASMKDLTTSSGGRASPRRNRRWPGAGSRWLCAVP
jgi:hypothetical protein